MHLENLMKLHEYHARRGAGRRTPAPRLPGWNKRRTDRCFWFEIRSTRTSGCESHSSFHETTWNNRRVVQARDEWTEDRFEEWMKRNVSRCFWLFWIILAFKVSHFDILIRLCAVPVQAMMLEQKSTDAEEKSRRVGETWPSQRFLLKVSLFARLQLCNPFIVFHSHLRLNDCSNFRIPSFFIECESTASAEGEQRLARAKLKRAWNLLCRTETKQPRTRKNQRQISRETLCVTLSFFFELAIQLSIVRSPKVAASD